MTLRQYSSNAEYLVPNLSVLLLAYLSRVTVLLCAVLYSHRNTCSAIRKLTRRIEDLEMNPQSDKDEIQDLKDQRSMLKQEQQDADEAREFRRGGGGSA